MMLSVGLVGAGYYPYPLWMDCADIDANMEELVWLTLAQTVP
jgi:hypothetical protein